VSYKVIEVEVENGVVRCSTPAELPLRAHGLLTLYANGQDAPAKNCAELADWWGSRERLPAGEASSFADDIEKGRSEIGPLKSAWD
jgi:hypothetical protein